MAASTPTEVSTSQTRSSYDYNNLWCRSHFSACSSGMATSMNSEWYDFITFLEACQNLKIDFLPITWQPALDRLGIGAQSDVRQSLINLSLSFAFNCVRVPRYLLREEEDSVFRALISQVSVLGHSEIRSHPNINNLVGVCWDVRLGEDIQGQGYIQPLRDVPSQEKFEAQQNTLSSKWKVWPVLVFEKSKHGDLDCFMRSASGSNLNLAERLKLCANIASGIRSLHDNCIIHGDIKPQNVLIFEERPGLYAAKLADLGRSIPFSNDDDRAPMACSTPWQAPEHSHRKMYQLSDMISMEVYSLGMVCLWLLFHEQLFALGITFDLRGMKAKGLDHLNALKNGGSMSEIAQNLTRKVQELSANQILDLTGFFGSCLAPNNVDRGSDISSLLQLLSDRSITSMALVSTATAMTTPSDELHKEFKISESALDFYKGDYRTRIYITSCLKGRLSQVATKDTGNKLQSQQAAFQLALCFRLGFGVVPDDGKVHEMLQQSVRPIQDLDKEILSIKQEDFRGKNEYYTSLSKKGFIGRMNYGDYYHKSGVLNEAKVELQKDMINLSQVFQDSEYILDIVQYTLAGIFEFQEQWKEAEELHTQTMKTSLRVLGEDHPSTLISMSNLASTYRKQGHWTEAERLEIQVMKTNLRVLGEEHSFTLISMSNLASTYRDQGHWTEAERLNMQMMKLSSKVLGEKHPSTLTSMANQALTYLAQGRWTAAERLNIQVMETRKKVLGEEHSSTLTSMNNLASTYRKQGRWTEAERLNMQVMKTEKKVLGEEHPSTLTSMSNLALIYGDQGRWKEAERLDVQVMKTNKKVLGEEHPSTLISMANLASTYWNQGRWTEAERLNIQAVKTSKKVLGEEHPSTLSKMNNLAHTYNAQGCHEEAAALMRNVIRLFTAVIGPRHPDTLASVESLKAWSNKRSQIRTKQSAKSWSAGNHKLFSDRGHSNSRSRSKHSYSTRTTQRKGHKTMDQPPYSTGHRSIDRQTSCSIARRLPSSNAASLHPFNLAQ